MPPAVRNSPLTIALAYQLLSTAIRTQHSVHTNSIELRLSDPKPCFCTRRRLLVRWQGLARLLTVMVESLTSVGWLTLLLFLVIFVWALLGMQVRWGLRTWHGMTLVHAFKLKVEKSSMIILDDRAVY